MGLCSRSGFRLWLALFSCHGAGLSASFLLLLVLAVLAFALVLALVRLSFRMVSLSFGSVFASIALSRALLASALSFSRLLLSLLSLPLPAVLFRMAFLAAVFTKHISLDGPVVGRNFTETKLLLVVSQALLQGCPVRAAPVQNHVLPDFRAKGLEKNTAPICFGQFQLSKIRKLCFSSRKLIFKMPNDVCGVPQVLAPGVKLQAVIADKNCFHPRNNAVLRGDGPNHLVPAGTLSLPLGARANDLQTSLPLREGLLQVVKQLRASSSSLWIQNHLLNLRLDRNAKLQFSHKSFLL